MLDGGVGLLRTLPPARPEDVDRLRLLAPALGVDWPADAGPGAAIAGLDPTRPGHAAFLEEAAHPAPRGRLHTVRRRPAGAAAATAASPPRTPTSPPRCAGWSTASAPRSASPCPPTSEPAPDLRAALPGAARPSWRPPTGAPARSSAPPSTPSRPGCCAAVRGRSSRPWSSTPRTARGTVALDGLAVRGRCEGAGLMPGTRVHVRLEEADVAGRRSASASRTGRVVTRVPYLTARLQGFGTTVFAEMSALAVATGLGQPRPGLPRLPRPARGPRRRPRRDRHRRRPVPAGPGHPRAPARRSPSTGSASAGLALRPRHRGAGHRRRHRGALRCAARAARHRRRGRAVRADVRLLRGRHRDGRRRGPPRPAPAARPTAGRWTFDPAELRAAITPRTKLLLLNTPHNPTGKVFTARGTGRPRRRTPSSTTCSCSPTRSTSTWSSAAPGTSRSPRCPACATARSSSAAPARPST